MTNRIAFALILGITSLPAARAEEPAPAPKPPPYELKHKSSFTTLGENDRAPFWPIGFSKRKVVATPTETTRVAVEGPKVVLEEKNFKVTSILLGNPSLAIINGRTYSEGEFLRMPRPAAATAATATPIPLGARVRLYRINDGSVVLQNQDQLLTVTLARPELVQRNGVEE